MINYIRIIRLDHWIKQLFILPGVLFAYILIKPEISISILHKLFVGFVSTCFVASSNYVINEWLDAGFDKYHPTKKYRSVVENEMNPIIIYTLYLGLAIIGGVLAKWISPILLYLEIWLWMMGIIYNVKPLRTKDIPIIDVLSESINNAIRLLIGWFIVSSLYFPPISIIVGYWFSGAFLMTMKRFAEYRMIADADLAGAYRKSFKFYTEKSLLLSAFFYAMCSVLFVGIFLIKYRIELILFMPCFIGLFCYYFYLAFKEDSAVQKPEKLFREKGLMIYCMLLCILFLTLMLIDIPFLNVIISEELVKFT